MKLLIICISLFTLFPRCANNAQPEATEKVAEVYNAEKGEKLFRSKCGACHGIGIRMVGPALITFDNVNKAYDPKKEPHRSTKVTPQELKQISDYVDKNRVFIDNK
ncbi:hypothetical protein D0C36_08645 [Mucilaginibacter conchicola]|uniref:Cytochrome c domain-containing protein n=1 Tax=Mucilaginibacter conchicola TaxID=2303333 RepID=A0A372NZX2_9SPHI|nr:cytochrome c [Mucilaginibacter conchicola]RFZ95572.1 hypothetical protein D0C36_08645 [Mucilaginibacter conchicola]